MKKLVWTEELIRQSFERFVSEHGRLSTALEVDDTNYLPSSRHIQRVFGGLKKLRLVLGYADCNFGAGSYRSEISHRVNTRGRASELQLETKLREIFGEVFVHTEKIFSTYKTRVDFYVYSPEGNFGVDIFYPDNMRTLQSNLNIKMSKYNYFQETLFYVIANGDITQDMLNLCATSKKNQLMNSHKLVTLETFLHEISKMRAYPNPLLK